MDNLKIGQIITEPQHRDAIHIAVAPVIAGMKCRPGERVGFGPDGRVCNGEDINTIGIIDPFLCDQVEEGQHCWLFLFPGSITSLRHEWIHPAFPEPVAPVTTTTSDVPSWLTPDVVALCESMRASKDYSALPQLGDALEEAGFDDADVLRTCREARTWKPVAACTVCRILGGELAESVAWLDTFACELEQTYTRLMEAADEWVKRQEYTYDDTEAYKDVDYDRWPVFWKHYEVVTGSKPKSETDTFFTCSC